MRAGSRLALGAALCLLNACVLAAGPGADWAVRGPSADPVVYRGLANYDAAGMPGGPMMYPVVGGVAGLFAAILTHGVIVEGTKSAEKSRLQEQADQVLSQHRDQLREFRYPALLRLALDRLGGEPPRKLLQADETHPGWVLAVAPSFLMTTDARALVLDSAVAFFPPGESRIPAQTVTVRVVSRPQSGDAHAVWATDATGGSKLKSESASLLAHAIVLATEEARREGSEREGPQRTLRYQLGGAEQMERAQLLRSDCGRAIARTLRGWILSAPASGAAEVTEAPECAGTAWR